MPSPTLESSKSEWGQGVGGESWGLPPLGVSGPLHELWLIMSLYPPHQKKSAPNQGEILRKWVFPIVSF